jgi:hypothetical protein
MGHPDRPGQCVRYVHPFPGRRIRSTRRLMVRRGQYQLGSIWFHLIVGASSTSCRGLINRFQALRSSDRRHFGILFSCFRQSRMVFNSMTAPVAVSLMAAFRSLDWAGDRLTGFTRSIGSAHSVLFLPNDGLVDQAVGKPYSRGRT